MGKAWSILLMVILVCSCVSSSSSSSSSKGRIMCRYKWAASCVEEGVGICKQTCEDKFATKFIYTYCQSYDLATPQCACFHHC